MKLIRPTVRIPSVLLPPANALELRPGHLEGQAIYDVCVIHEVRSGLAYAWDKASEALFGDGDFTEASELMRSVLKDLFAITVQIRGDTTRVANSIEELNQLIECPQLRNALIDRQQRAKLSRAQRKAFIVVMNRVKKEFKKLELKTIEPSRLRRIVMQLFGSDIKLTVSPELREQARQSARIALRGASDALAERVRIAPEIRKAFLAFDLNMWSTVDDYQTRKRELFKMHHPDHGGDKESFLLYQQHAKSLDQYFESLKLAQT